MRGLQGVGRGLGQPQHRIRRFTGVPVAARNTGDAGPGLADPAADQRTDAGAAPAVAQHRAPKMRLRPQRRVAKMSGNRPARKLPPAHDGRKKSAPTYRPARFQNLGKDK